MIVKGINHEEAVNRAAAQHESTDRGMFSQAMNFVKGNPPVRINKFASPEIWY